MPDAEKLSESRDRAAWLPGAATALAVLSCYGTTAAIAMLATLGLSLALDKRLWAGAIGLLAAVAAATVAAAYRRHRTVGPVIAATVGLGLILWALYGTYSRLTELGGFLALAVAALWDWRLRRRAAGFPSHD